jgi:hypothetical protein
MTSFITKTDANYYTKLSNLRFYSSNLTSVDISNMPALTYVQGGLAYSANVQNPAFTQLIVNTSLNYYPVLADIYVYYNGLTTVNTTGMPALKTLNVNDSEITTLDLSKNPLLKSLVIQNNDIQSLDISKNPLLESVNCMNNKITTLVVNQTPNYYPVLNDLRVATNKLTFDYLEPHMGKYTTFIYSTQTPDINTAYTTNVQSGGTINFTVQTGGVNNQYQWQKKNGGSWTNIAGQTSANFVKTNATSTDAGVYRCAITNTLVTGLTLYRAEITLTINAAGRIAASELEDQPGSEVDADLEIYPVPAAHQITVRVSKEEQGIHVNLISTTGIVLKEANSSSNTVIIDVNDLASGIYLIKVRTIDGMLLRKVSVNR